MTAVRRHLTLRSRAWRRRGERLLVSLGVLLPIPLFAVSGLSLPLPATVERLAAALVPWAEAATQGNQVLARGPGGSIVRLGGEQGDGTSYALGESEPAGAELRAEGGRNAPGKDDGTSSRPGGGSTPAEDGDGREENAPAEGGGTREQPAPQEPVKADPPGEEPIRNQDPTPPPPPPPPAPPPPPPPPPGPGIVDDTVDDVDGTVDPVTDEVDDTVDDVGDTVDKILPGLGK